MNNTAVARELIKLAKQVEDGNRVAGSDTAVKMRNNVMKILKSNGIKAKALRNMETNPYDEVQVLKIAIPGEIEFQEVYEILDSKLRYIGTGKGYRYESAKFSDGGDAIVTIVGSPRVGIYCSGPKKAKRKTIPMYD